MSRFLPFDSARFARCAPAAGRLARANASAQVRPVRRSDRQLFRARRVRRDVRPGFVARGRPLIGDLPAGWFFPARRAAPRIPSPRMRPGGLKLGIRGAALRAERRDPAWRWGRAFSLTQRTRIGGRDDATTSEWLPGRTPDRPGLGRGTRARKPACGRRAASEASGVEQANPAHRNGAASRATYYSRRLRTRSRYNGASHSLGPM